MKKQERHKKKQSCKAVVRILVTLLILISGLLVYRSIRGGDRTLLTVFHIQWGKGRFTDLSRITADV